MTEETINKIIAKLTEGVAVPSLDDIEALYPARQLPTDAHVVRVAPSPTGFVHIGTVYAALLCWNLAHHSGGVYFLRVEDTDKKREVTDGVALIANALTTFGLTPDEGAQVDGAERGAYGPYKQSERQAIYLAYAVQLLRQGRAYPCFATREELDNNVKKQQAAKVRPGYYGDWALWRNKSDAEVQEALAQKKPFVLRFKSQGTHDARVTFSDKIKGELSLPQNDLDVPLIKADGTQLPTYHLAHVVDDTLMGTTIVLRGDEWLPSTPLHIELAEAIGKKPFTYAHIAPITIIDKNGGGKRKLSKRKDPEANVAYFYDAGYPVEGLRQYLLGLASSDFEDWYKQHSGNIDDFVVSFEKLAKSRAPLFDPVKLQDYCKEYFAQLQQEEFNEQIISWAKQHNEGFYNELVRDPVYTNDALSIERGGDKPRKDLYKLTDSEDLYGYFFDNLYDLYSLWTDHPFDNITADEIRDIKEAFLQTYTHDVDQPTWFENMKKAADTAGYAVDAKAYKEAPQNYKGKLADFVQVIRYAVTLGKTRTPDLYAIMQIMREDRVRQRLS